MADFVPFHGDFASRYVDHFMSPYYCKACTKQLMTQDGNPSPRGKGHGFCSRCYFRWYRLDEDAQADFPTPYENVSHKNRGVAFAILNPVDYQQGRQEQQAFLGGPVVLASYIAFWAREQRAVDAQLAHDLRQLGPGFPVLDEAIYLDGRYPGDGLPAPEDVVGPM